MKKILLCLLALGAPAFAVEDTSPVDAKGILQALQAMKDQQTSLIRANKQRYIQEANAAAANPARAAELWEEAVRAIQFDGAAKESAKFHDWKEKDGDALRSKEGANALRLYFNWLSLTLQRAAGAETKALLPLVMSHVRELAADELAMDAFDEAQKREQQNSSHNATSRDREKIRDGTLVKRVHDSILDHSVTGSVYVQANKIAELISDVAPAKRNQASASGWEATPGNYDGIYQTIILPELREQKDVRALDYWDAKLRRETEQASRQKLTFELEKFNGVRRPQLLWSRAQELARVGQKNRAATEMFALIKSFPTHPDAPGWMAELESNLKPAPVMGTVISEGAP